LENLLVFSAKNPVTGSNCHFDDKDVQKLKKKNDEEKRKRLERKI